MLATIELMLTTRPARAVIIGRIRYLVSVIGAVTFICMTWAICVSGIVERIPLGPMPALLTKP